MAEKLFKGVGIALVTPFDESGAIDEASLRSLVSYVIMRGADFLTVLGTTAESVTMSPEERATVVEIVADENGGRLPLLLGLGGNCTEAVVKDLKECSYTKHCQGILSVVPYYNKPSQNGIYEHFKAIAEASPLPVVIYNVPGRTGVNITAATTKRLAEDCVKIIGIKEATSDMQQAVELLKIERKDFSILSGEDGLVMPLMAMGFDGVISVAANCMTGLFAEMAKGITSGDLHRAAELHIKLSDFCKAIFEEGNPAGIKSALYISGLIKHPTLRLPLVAISEELTKKMVSICGALHEFAPASVPCTLNY